MSLHPTFRIPGHYPCEICDQFVRYRQRIHAANLAKIRAVAASLPRLRSAGVNPAQESKNPPVRQHLTGSTDSNRGQDGMKWPLQAV